MRLGSIGSWLRRGVVDLRHISPFLRGDICLLSQEKNPFGRAIGLADVIRTEK